MKPIWAEDGKRNGFSKLPGDAKTDVLIIGGGMAGVLCAYFLDKAGVEYILVEGKTVGSGVTGNTTAKITSQHGLVFQELLRRLGKDRARLYLEANQMAVEEFKSLCGDISCDFEQKDAFVYSKSNRKAIENEVTALDALGFDAEFLRETALPFEIAGAVKFSNQAQFNPVKFIEGISRNLKIYENTLVREIGKGFAKTDSGVIKAENIVIATHFPIINKHGGYFLKMYQQRSYVIALENAANLNGMYLEAEPDGLSFRNYKDMLLLGGGGHKTGKSGGNWQVLREFAKRTYPEAAERFAWATQDCITLDHVPYVGHYSKCCRNMFVATGFNKWGMTSSMVSAMLLADTILGRDNKFAELYSPSRNMLRPQLAINGLNAIANLLSFGAKRCPHMGCALKWNSAEHSWDCPCHGSRFDKNGKVLNNPATGDLKNPSTAAQKNADS